MDLKKLIFMGFLSIAAWQDVRRLSVKLWVYAVFGMLGLCICISQGASQLYKSVTSCILPGLLLLAMHKFSRGAVGDGDGWFFIVSGLYVSLKENLYLLFFGLLLCSIWCAFLVIWGVVHGINMKKYKIPFLPFLFPIGIWLVAV